MFLYLKVNDRGTDFTVDEKLDIMETEYGTTIEEELREEVNEMSNLGEGIKEEGIAIGEAKIILKMHDSGFSAEQIAKVTEKSVDEVKAIIAGKEPVFA